MDYNLVALLPMKHTSRRVPGKNYRPFGDEKPLFEHILSALLKCKSIEKVVINTDSPIIKEICAEKYSENVIIIDRPKELAQDTTPTNEVIKYDIERVKSKFYLQTHSTNPLLSTLSLNSAIKTFLEIYPNYNSLFSVNKMQTRLWDALGRPINHNQNILLRTQDLPPIYEENSCIYIFEREIFLNSYNRIGTRPYMYETKVEESLDIDSESDFAMAELYYKQLNKQ